MFRRLGARRYIIPLIIGVVLAFVMGLMFYPMAHMEMKNMPFAVLSLDKGTEVAGEEVNVGDTLVDNLIDSTESDDDEDPAIAWTKMDSQKELDEALDNHEYYGAIIVPKDYSEKQIEAQQAESEKSMEQAQAMLEAQQAAAAAAGAAGDAAAAAAAGGNADAAAAAAAGSADAADAASTLDISALTGDSDDDEADEDAVEVPPIKIELDNFKSPLIATQMQSQFNTMFATMGLDTDIEVLNAGPTDDESDDSDDDEAIASGNMMGGMMTVMLTIMPLLMASAIAALFLNRILNPRTSTEASKRWTKFGIQVLYAIVVSFIIACCVYGCIVIAGGINIDFGGTMPFMWLASFCIILCFVGLYDFNMILGVFVLACCFFLGMMTGTLPYEALPTFWADWVYPWAPQHFLSEGMRSVIYLDAGIWNNGTLPMMIFGIIGAVFGCLGALIPHRKKDVADEA